MATALKLKSNDPLAELYIKLISADNHINEPRNLFIDRFPKYLKDKAPRVIEGAGGGEGWSMDGSTPPKRTYGLEAMAGWDRKDYRVSGLRYSDIDEMRDEKACRGVRRKYNPSRVKERCAYV